MSNRSSVKGPYHSESVIFNIDARDGSGTYWVAYKKICNNDLYFDSFGDLRPLSNLVGNRALITL